MKKLLLTLMLGIFLFSGLSALAASTSTIGMLPDNTFYFLKSWKESIQTFLTFNQEKKMNQYLHLADVRLAEYQKMMDKNKTELAQKVLDKYQKQLNKALEKAKTLKNKEEALTTVASSTERHIQVLQENLAKAPEAAKKGLQNAIENSSKVKEQASPQEQPQNQEMNQIQNQEQAGNLGPETSTTSDTVVVEPSTTTSPSNSSSSAGQGNGAQQGKPTVTNYTLTIVKNGNGTISGNGISCGTTCSKTYNVGENITLTASASPSNTFGGWGGDCSGTASTCTVKMDKSKSVIATFNTVVDRKVNLINPNGGESVSGTYNITWTSNGSATGDTVNVSLINETNSSLIETTTIANNLTYNTNSYSWIIASTIKSGEKYKVKVEYCNSKGCVSDTSDNYFTIPTVISASTPIKIVTPTENVFYKGRTYTITWENSSLTNISLATICNDNTYYRIADNIAASQLTYSLMVPYYGFKNPCKLWIGEYRLPKATGNWTDISAQAYEKRYGEKTNINIIAEGESVSLNKVLASPYASIYYAIFRMIAGF